MRKTGRKSYFIWRVREIVCVSVRERDGENERERGEDGREMNSQMLSYLSKYSISSILSTFTHLPATCRKPY